MEQPAGSAAPNVPAVQAPAAPAPASPAQPQQQHSLAEAQITAPVVMPAAPAAPTAPTAPTAPAVTPTQPDPAAVAEQRVKDAQRKMHEATAEAARMRNQLNSILNHPQLGPVIQRVTNPQAPANNQDDEVKQAFKAWQAAPTDEDAFRHLIATAEARAKRAVLQDLQNREIERVNRARAQQRDLAVAQAINKEVSDKAPDVPLELFWAMSSKAELETPPDLVTMADKLEWQIQRSIALARDVLAPRTQQMQQNQQQNQQVRQSAAVVMPAGSAAPGAGGTPAQGVTSFVDQLKAAQARKIPATN